MTAANDAARSKKERAQMLLQKRMFPEAKAIYEELLQAEQSNPEYWEALGHINQNMKRLHEAAECYRKQISLKPDHLPAYYNLAVVLEIQEEYLLAAECYRTALRIAPAHPVLHYNLGNILHKLTRLDEAMQCYRRALELKPDIPEAYNNLGLVLAAAGRPEDAIASYRKAVEIRKDFLDAYNNLGVILAQQDKLGEAVACCQQALAIKPDNPLTLSNLGTALSLQGKYDEAIDRFRASLRINPDNPSTHSDLLLNLNYHPDLDPSTIFAEHIAWGKRHGAAVHVTHSFNNTRDPMKRIRIGYVSPNFYTHSVAYFVEPILAHHDPEKVETFCYSDARIADTTTERLSRLTNHWRSIHGLATDRVAGLIRSDGIDILIDLAGHTGFNRLPVFALKPAPVQVSYLGYPNTTGLTTMDYRLTDISADPPGQERLHTEKLVRLPHGFLCYKPSSDVPVTTQIPAKLAGYVTFASFNNPTKMNPEVVALWARILKALPRSRLILKYKSLNDGATRERYTALFAENGISPERLELIGWIPAGADHLAVYHKADIALDTFPYNGTTTTCEALWIGVPVITLAGNRHAGRVGTSLLTQAGLTEFIADTQDHYVELVVALANDLDRLASLRATLRDRAAKSALCDGAGFTRDLEEAYRDMWQQWCAMPQPG